MAQTNSSKDMYLLIDATGSMVGLPAGSRNRDVMRDLLRQVAEHTDFYCREGDRLHVATFRDGLYDLDGSGDRFSSVREFNMRSGYADAAAYILSIHDAVLSDQRAASGRTGIYSSISTLLDRMEANRETLSASGSLSPEHSQQLLVFTDGEDNASRQKILEILRRHAFLRGPAQLGDHLFVKLYVFGDATPPFSPEDLPWERRAPGARITAPVRVAPSMIELGNVRDAAPMVIPIRLYPADPRIRTATADYIPAGALPSSCVTLQRDVRFTEGRGELRFSFPRCDQADRLLASGGALQTSGTIGMRFNDERFELASPARLQVTGSYSGIKDVALHLRFDPAAFLGHGLNGIARTSDSPRSIPLLDARFSSLAMNDSIRVSLQHLQGTSPAAPVLLAAGSRTGMSVIVDRNAPTVELRISGDAMPAGKALYELRMEVPPNLAFRVVSDRGKPLPVSSSTPAFRFDLLGAGPVRRPPHDPFIYVWTMVIIALPATVAVYFGMNRPPRRVRLTGTTLSGKPLRRAQGFFSDWVDIGPRSGSKRRVLVDSALPTAVFRIRSTRWNGTEIAPRAQGLVVDGREVKPGEIKRVSKHSKIEYHFEGRIVKYELH
jgi:hypothetical protein